MKHFTPFFALLFIGLVLMLAGCGSHASRIRDKLGEGKVRLGLTRAKDVFELWGKASSVSAHLENRKKNEFGFEGRKVERHTYKNRNLIMIFEGGILVGFEAIDNTRPGNMRPPRKRSEEE